ncbi:MAG: sigma factor [Prolixibacteraceae bacterium]|nr:sigma factor [Prolixibacteraceae bacterium]
MRKIQYKTFNCSNYKQIFDSLYEPLCKYCYRFVLSTEVSEDIVQDTFVYLWGNWNRLLQMQSLKSYLYTTVKNRSLKHLKKLYSIIDLVAIEDSNDDFIDVEQPTADELLEYHDLKKK